MIGFESSNWGFRIFSVQDRWELRMKSGRNENGFFCNEQWNCNQTIANAPETQHSGSISEFPIQDRYVKPKNSEEWRVPRPFEIDPATDVQKKKYIHERSFSRSDPFRIQDQSMSETGKNSPKSIVIQDFLANSNHSWNWPNRSLGIPKILKMNLKRKGPSHDI